MRELFPPTPTFPLLSLHLTSGSEGRTVTHQSPQQIHPPGLMGDGARRTQRKGRVTSQEQGHPHQAGNAPQTLGHCVLERSRTPVGGECGKERCEVVWEKWQNCSSLRVLGSGRRTVRGSRGGQKGAKPFITT
jgi:hypothetical protein